MLLSAQFEGAPMPRKKAETSGTPISLPELRQRIDSVDRQIQDLIAERAGYARQVGVAKHTQTCAARITEGGAIGVDVIRVP